MMPRPKTDVLPDGPRKLAGGARVHLIHSGIHVRTGLPVRDALQPRYVTVTDEDATKATIGDPRLCAFSQCARRTIPGLTDVEFYVSKAYLIFDDHVVRYSIGGSTGRALAAFDLTGKFAPGQYYLSAISHSEAIRTPHVGKNAKPKTSRAHGVSTKKAQETTEVAVKTKRRQQPPPDEENSGEMLVKAGPVGKIIRSIQD